jgi:protease-4
MRKHPVIFGLLLLCLIGFVFFLLIYGLGTFTRDRHAFSLGSKVGVVTVEGIISDAEEVVAQLDEFGSDDRIKAVILRIDSPGGGVAPAQEIYDAVSDLKKKKKVIASMGSYAASGGYLVACAADRIVANPGTITGSISAVMHFANAEELMKKVGLRASVIKSGKYKDIGSPVREMTPDERALIQGLVDDIYDQFLEIVARDRKIKKEELREIADGRVFSGRQAQKLKLVDFLGDMKYAVRLAGKMSGIVGEPDVVYAGKHKRSIWELILREMTSLLARQMQERKAGLAGVSYLCDK